ncbi:PQQ-like beta-propeller repeat protein [Actinoplanes sp. KI2]|uniref:PQQ-like beta-propeller repeat protein n=1 Tax=Actinoplanes sp. KI2 TaxID=2983315 RepID=UPI0021D5E257|nr:PQQ-like beta-propeller repeat protein [Actinoplanes sp. KI2]MCU7730474.1 PQQ-like beta-propeller repeat protein [Actinoplanes sp. KI2]
MRHLRWSGHRRAWIAAGALGLPAALLPAGSAAADPARWATVSADVSPAATPGYNFNTDKVAVLGASDGKVRLTRDGRIVEDLGRPPGARVGKLAISGTEVYALTADRSVIHFNRDTRRWENLATGMIDLVASRSGSTVTADNQPPRFIPDLYAVGAGGGVSRLHGDAQLQDGTRLWETIDSGWYVDSLAERGNAGATTLFGHSTGGTVRQWSGTRTTWTVIGGPFASISADNGNLVATDAAGKPQLYGGTPDNWHSYAMPAGVVLPYEPGGRAIAAADKIYYRTGTGDIFGLRSVFAAVDVISGWVHLAAGPVVALAPHIATETGAAATALRTDGTLTELTWATIRMARVVATPRDAEAGGLYQDTETQAADWSGPLAVAIVSGSLPPGITAGTNPHGELMLAGTPTATGTFAANLVLYDGTGATFPVPTTIRVVDGPGPVVTGRHWVNPTSSLTLANCLSDGAALTVWTREFTAGDSDPDPAWEDRGSIPSSAGLPACTATTAGRIPYTPPPNHTVELVGLDTGAPNCAGRNDPDLAGCVLFHRLITGKAGLAPDVVTLTG